MKNINNKLKNINYNKHNFYYNEWYVNMYISNKYKYFNNIYFTNSIYIFLDRFFNSYKSYYNKNLINKINNKNTSFIKTNRIFIDVVEIKYFINKIYIILYVYNRLKINIIKKINKLKFSNNNNLFNVMLPNNKDSLLKNKLLILNNKINLYKIYTSILYLNNFKFNLLNLYKIKNILYKLLGKKIEIKITNIKYFYNNNNIMLNTLTRKINKNSYKIKQKTQVLRILRKSLRFAKIGTLIWYLKIKKFITNNDSILISKYKEISEQLNNSNILSIVFNKSSNIHMLGLRLEAKGRITKRLTASRTMKKVNYKGNISNIYSKINNNSSINFKGYQRSNINYLNNNNQNLLGTYGIKYWTSSY
jgi:hypothetical protein